MSEQEKELSEEELLAQWQDMADNEEGGENAQGVDSTLPERILDQDEIDSLLGIDNKEAHGGVGISALLDTTVVNYERLPMLDVLFDKFERYLSTSLRHFTGDNVDITVDNITTVRFGEFLSSIPLPAGISVVNAVGLDDYILMIYERRLIYAVVDVLLGGRKAKPARIEGRNFTPIERRIVDSLSDIVLNDLSEAFAPVAPVQFTSERMEENPRFANIARPGNAAILVTVRVNIEERDGIIQFCLPYGTLEPIREQLLQQFMGEKFGQDNIWESHLAQELYYTNVPLRAVLGEEMFSLRDVLKWRLGDTIRLHVKPNQPVKLYCGKEKKLEGELGKLDDFKAIRVTKNVADVNNEETEK